MLPYFQPPLLLRSPLPRSLAKPTFLLQVSLLGEPPKDYRIPLNPYLNLHSLLPSSNLAGKETRGWGGSGRGRRPAEPPLPSPAVPGGGSGSNNGNKAFQMKSRLLSPIASNRLPPEPGLPDSYGFDYPTVSTGLPYILPLLRVALCTCRAGSSADCAV